MSSGVNALTILTAHPVIAIAKTKNENVGSLTSKRLFFINVPYILKKSFRGCPRTLFKGGVMCANTQKSEAVHRVQPMPPLEYYAVFL